MRIRSQVQVDEMQFGFMQGKGTTDAIFVVRQMVEKHLAKKRQSLESKKERTKMRMIRWMRNVSLKERQLSTET